MGRVFVVSSYQYSFVIDFDQIWYDSLKLSSDKIDQCRRLFGGYAFHAIWNRYLFMELMFANLFQIV